MARLFALALIALLVLVAPVAGAQGSPPRDIQITPVADGLRITWTQTSAANWVSLVRVRPGVADAVIGGVFGTLHAPVVVTDPFYQTGDHYEIREYLLGPAGTPIWQHTTGPLYPAAVWLPMVER